MLQTLCEFLFALSLAIGVPVGLMAILLFFMSIPVVLCHWTYEWTKDFVNSL